MVILQRGLALLHAHHHYGVCKVIIENVCHFALVAHGVEIQVLEHVLIPHLNVIHFLQMIILGNV